MPVGHVAGVEHASSILADIPLVWLALAVPLAWRGRSAGARSTLCGFLAAVVLLFGICALTIALFCTTAQRYEVEFLPALALLAVVGILSVERTLACQPLRPRAMRWLWSLLLGFSVAFNLLVSVKQSAEWHCEFGAMLVRLGKVQEAIDHYEQALRLKPDLAVAHYDLGIALAGQSKVQEAINHYEQALRIEPDYAEAHNNLGIALVRLGKMQEAIEQYQQALRIRPDYAEARYNLGNAWVRLGWLQEAIDNYEQALRIQPDFADACNNLAWLLATHGPAEGGDAVRAVDLAQQACELTGNRQAGHLDTLAAAYAAAGRFREAVATAQKAIELARAAGQPKLVAEVEARLELYRSGHACFQSVGNDESKQPLANPSNR